MAATTEYYSEAAASFALAAGGGLYAQHLWCAVGGGAAAGAALGECSCDPSECACERGGIADGGASATASSSASPAASPASTRGAAPRQQQAGPEAGNQVCRFFVVDGAQCGYGGTFAHAWRQPSAGAEARGVVVVQRSAPPVCSFHLRGRCHYGAACRFTHPQDAVADQEAADGGEPAAAAAPQPVPIRRPHDGGSLGLDPEPMMLCSPVNAPPTPPRGVEASASAAASTSTSGGSGSGDGVCGVCLEPVVASGRRFGLLSGCEHCFCLDCLREWRSRCGEVDPDAARSCPLCRTLSHYVVPSPTFAVGEAKDGIVAEYKATLAQKPCRYFAGGAGVCPFGPHCFYAHVDMSTGHDTKPEELAAWQQASQARRGARGGRRRRRRGNGSAAWRDAEEAADDTAELLRQLLVRMNLLAADVAEGLHHEQELAWAMMEDVQGDGEGEGDLDA